MKTAKIIKNTNKANQRLKMRILENGSKIISMNKVGHGWMIVKIIHNN